MSGTQRRVVYSVLLLGGWRPPVCHGPLRPTAPRGPRAAGGRAAIERGVLLRPLGDVLYALPPACTTDDEARRIGQTMRALVEAHA